MATYVYCPVKKKVVLKGEEVQPEQHQLITRGGTHEPDVRIVGHTLHKKQDGMDQFWHKFDARGRPVFTSRKDIAEFEARTEGRYKYDP